MTDAAEKSGIELLFERVGLENVNPSSTMGRLLREGGPSKTREFRRIHALPRRDWEADSELDELAELLTLYLKTPDGKMDLWRVQAAALRDTYEQRGLFAPVAVGKGKALISLMAPEVLKAERPLLLVPAQLREQTKLYVLPDMRHHWKLTANLTILAYSELSLAKNARILEELKPDLIIADECHRLKNKTAGRTRRVIRYMDANPETAFVALSGTITTRSIRDYGHILRWCLKNRTPLPESWRELTQWADAIDVGVENRGPPGALIEWSADNSPELPEVRKGYRDRLVQTPGVIATQETELGVSLQLLARRPDMPMACYVLLSQLNETWETPDGDYITEAVDLWRHAREICCGFWYKWDPPPPAPWLEARKEWKRYVRETLKHSSRRALDTELQVWNECAEQHGRPRRPVMRELDDEATEAEVEAADAEHDCRLEAWRRDKAAWELTIDPTHCFWCAWRQIRHTFEPNKVPEWVDDFAIRDATEWLRADDSGGIVWTEHIAFAERLSKFSGFPYFGAGSKANIGIAEHRGPCIASIRAHGEGKNLQHHSRNLIPAPPSSGKTWEQLIGRTHREGQLADEVTFEINLHAAELLASFNKAWVDAHYLEHTLGSRQKLLYADRNFEVTL